MRRRHFIPLSISSAALLIAAVAMPAQSQQRPNQLPPPGAQQKPGQPLPPPGGKPAPQQPAAAAPAPYQPVAITAPKPIADPSFEAFRNQIAEVAKRKDKKALAALVSPTFFWMGEKGDKADKKKPMVEGYQSRCQRRLGLGGAHRLRRRSDRCAIPRKAGRDLRTGRSGF